MRIDKICSYCGSHFVAKTTVTKFCDISCAQKAYKQKERARKIAETEIETEMVVYRRRVERKKESAQREILSIQQTSEYLGVSRMTIHRMMRAGELPFTKLGGRVLILKRTLDQILGL